MPKHYENARDCGGNRPYEYDEKRGYKRAFAEDKEIDLYEAWKQAEILQPKLTFQQVPSSSRGRVPLPAACAPPRPRRPDGPPEYLPSALRRPERSFKSCAYLGLSAAKQLSTPHHRGRPLLFELENPVLPTKSPFPPSPSSHRCMRLGRPCKPNSKSSRPPRPRREPRIAATPRGVEKADDRQGHGVASSPQPFDGPARTQ